MSNPPYIAEAELADLPADVRDHEPVDALIAGPTGLEALEEIIGGAAAWLAPGGVLVCEIAPHQADAVIALALANGFGEAVVRHDLAARPRVLVARRG